MSPSSSLNFIFDFVLCPEESDLSLFLKEVEHCDSDSCYKNMIDNIIFRYTTEYHDVYVRNVIIEFFSKINNRKNLRKYMYEKLNSNAIKGQSMFEFIVESVDKEVKDDIKMNGFKVPMCLKALNFLSTYIQNFTDNSKYFYLLDIAFPFYFCIMEVYTNKIHDSIFLSKVLVEYSESYNVLLLCVKQLAMALPRVQYDGLRTHSVQMVILTHKILQNNHLNFDIKCKCIIIMSHYSLYLPQEELQFVKYRTVPMLDFIDNKRNDFCMVLNCKRLENLFITDSMKIVFNLGLYSTLNCSGCVNVMITNKPLLEFIYENLINLGIRNTSFPDKVESVSRTLNAMSKNLRRLQNFDGVFEKAVAFSWGHLDHFVDQVVMCTKSFLRCMITEAGRRYEAGDPYSLEQFFKGINSLSVFSKVRLNALASISQVIDCDIILNKCPDVKNQLLVVATTSADHDVAGLVYNNMMLKHLQNHDEDQVIATWFLPILTALRKPNLKFEYVLQNIVISAFQQKPGIFPLLLSHITESSANECVVVLKCIHFARMHGMVLFSQSCDDEDELWRGMIAKVKMNLFMIHQDEEVRINTLRVVAECQKTTEVFTEWELSFLIRYFQYNVAAQTSSTRNKICTYYKKILTRYSTQKIEPCGNSGESASLQHYTSFFYRFIPLLVSYLTPDANYSRRSICLELLIHAYSFSSKCDWQAFFTQDDIANLKNILNDSYENNKAMAVVLLGFLPPRRIGFDSEEKTCEFFAQIARMACDVRPSQSLTASYMFQVVLQSEFAFEARVEKAGVTKRGLMVLSLVEKVEEMDEKGVSDSPFYGLLLGCRSLLKSRDFSENNQIYSSIFSKLVNLCLKIQKHIMPVVSNTSPEGYIPEENVSTFVEANVATKAQRILVFSWKTMKEIMLLLAELVSQTVSLENVYQMLPEEYLLKIGDFFMDVFVRTKHRGVFEQAHTAFSIICRSFIRSKKKTLNNLSVQWLEEGVALCTGQKTDDRLCATRRSAGLPFLILSVLPSLVETQRTHLFDTMDPIILKAQYEDDEIRIHCLNVLRFIFKNSKLSEDTAKFIDRGAIASLEGFRSKGWGVRNSATLLLSALTLKIFGVGGNEEGENRLTLAVFYTRYELLFFYLLKTLENEWDKNDSLILHPVLLILSRLFPSYNESINEQVKKQLYYINMCMQNPSYRTRELAAKASVSLIPQRFLREQLNTNFAAIDSRILTDKECHGILLQIYHILQADVIEDLPVTDYLSKSLHLLSENRKNSHLTVSLYTEVVFILVSRYNYNNFEVLKQIISLLWYQKPSNTAVTCHTSYAYNNFQLIILILLTRFQHLSVTYLLTTKLIINHLNSCDQNMKKKCLSFLISLNQNLSEDCGSEHPLFSSGDVEISIQIQSLVGCVNGASARKLLACLHPFLIDFFHCELKQLSNDSENLVLVFLLLRFYPCFWQNFKPKNQKVLDWFVTIARGRNEETVSAIISCIQTFVMNCNLDDLKKMHYSQVIKLLMESSAPTASDYRRLTVAQFMVSFRAKNILSEYDRYNLLNIIMVLLEDDEPIVRNTISDCSTTKATFHVIPNEARSAILKSFTSKFSIETGVSCLTAWALRRLPEVTRDTSEVYERGELNTFAENIPITQCVFTILHELLWKMCGGCVDVGEQIQVLTGNVLDSLVKVQSPMVDRHTKKTVISALQKIKVYKRESDGCFSQFFETRILDVLKCSVGSDYSSVKAFLIYLYTPILDERFRRLE